MAELIFTGLDGGNPLAYLAALGTLRTTALIWPESDARMYWSNVQGGWRPHLTLAGEIDRDDWLAALAQALQDNSGQTAFALADDLTVPCPAYKVAAVVAAANAVAGDRSHADFLTAFGSEVIETEKDKKKTGNIDCSAFRLLGGGQTGFLISGRTLAACTKKDHLNSSLFAQWKYDDPLSKNRTMRWDPTDDVRHALRWRNPSGDPERDKSGSMWGANRLAIEALPLLPTAPVRRRLETTGFTQRKGRGVVWTWPIWTVPVGLDVVRSLMSLPELQNDEPDRRALAAMSIAEVYRCQRITQGKYRNFTPAHPA
ncbi:MAG: hypothetical protein COS39_05560 [Hydrogenophilales bacterium CG03_land_8_20_14_0_80_62_28]|nr:hypothetical protein [Betaproteobacteria bacterium]OIO79177.1 MAG: hypothetical protein AUJ86_02990 [Hydrogenophilaceae bacterium CG1_02_62_390]PIV23014.1 MAG: hypothetical protein COS39_05560 [Hydrogenophilales bacterium CG03_land_8_20_14_0_80_62_28]